MPIGKITGGTNCKVCIDCEPMVDITTMKPSGYRCYGEGKGCVPMKRDSTSIEVTPDWCPNRKTRQLTRLEKMGKGTNETIKGGEYMSWRPKGWENPWKQWPEMCAKHVLDEEAFEMGADAMLETLIRQLDEIFGEYMQKHVAVDNTGFDVTYQMSFSQFFIKQLMEEK